DEIQTLPLVSDVISFVDVAGTTIPVEFPDAKTLEDIISPNYDRMVISLDVDTEGAAAFDMVKRIREMANKYYPDKYYLAGQGVSTYDLMDTITDDMVKVNIAAIAAVFIVLLMLVKNAVLPIILVLSIETSIWLNFSFPYFMDSVVFYMAYLIISSIQLGATVDYAILFSDRYRELRQSMDKEKAVIETVSAVTVSILTSGSVFSVVGFLLGFISSNQLLAQLGRFLGVGALLSLTIVLFVLPGLLYIFDGLFTGRKKAEKK
ncbi:MAG: MMPL family transporter, partial [Clostridia bacterium]